MVADYVFNWKKPKDRLMGPESCGVNNKVIQGPARDDRCGKERGRHRQEFWNFKHWDLVEVSSNDYSRALVIGTLKE